MTSATSLGHVGAAISNAVVGLHSRHYGKGPTRAKTYLIDDVVVCVMQDVFTTAEQTLIEHGKGELVREMRATFEQTMRDEFREAVRQATGRNTRSFTSQIDCAANVAVAFVVLSPTNRGNETNMHGGSDVEPTVRSEAVALSTELALVDGDTAVVSVRGELDRVSADQLKVCLRAAFNDGAKYLCIDLLEVQYMDSSGFGPMLEAYHRAQALGGAITVICREILCELFEVTGLMEVFAVRHRRVDGLAYLSSRE